MEELADPRFVEAENSRILTMVTALYVRFLYPDLTVQEVFEKLEDVEFVKEVIHTLLEEIDGNKGVEVVHQVRSEDSLEDPPER